MVSSANDDSSSIIRIGTLARVVGPLEDQQEADRDQRQPPGDRAGPENSTTSVTTRTRPPICSSFMLHRLRSATVSRSSSATYCSAVSPSPTGIVRNSGHLSGRPGALGALAADERVQGQLPHRRMPDRCTPRARSDATTMASWPGQARGQVVRQQVDADVAAWWPGSTATRGTATPTIM